MWNDKNYKMRNNREQENIKSNSKYSKAHYNRLVSCTFYAELILIPIFSIKFQTFLNFFKANFYYNSKPLKRC